MEQVQHCRIIPQSSALFYLLVWPLSAGLHQEIWVQQVLAVVSQRSTVGLRNTGTCCQTDGMPGGSVPLHGGSITGIIVGLAFCHKTELETASGTYHLDKPQMMMFGKARREEKLGGIIR